MGNCSYVSQSMRHSLLILPEYYSAIISGVKRFEIREKRDRVFSIGDILELKCGNERSLIVRVIYITDYGMMPDYICMSIEALKW